MSKIDRIEADIEATKAKLAVAEASLYDANCQLAKDEADWERIQDAILKCEARRDKMEALLTEQTAVWKILLAGQASTGQPARAPAATTGSVFQFVQPLLPPGPPDVIDNREFIVQLKLVNIDGTRFELSPFKGFRNYIKFKCDELGLKGYVWRVPVVHGKIVAAGTKAQLDNLIVFCKSLRSAGYIDTFTQEPAERNILIDSFDKLPSNRRHVQTGTFSDAKDDDVVSTTSADLPVLLGPPSPLPF
eukprot:gene8392-9969_t